MNKTRIKTMVVFVLALAVLAGEAIGQPGGRGRGGQGRGGGPGWGPGVGGPQMNADPDSAQPDNSWVPGPYCPWGQGTNQNIQPRQGRGPGGLGRNVQGPKGPYCPWGQGPNQNIQSRQGRGPGRFNRGRQGRGPGRFNQGFQGRGIGQTGRGFRRRDMITQRGPMAGRGGRGFQRGNTAPQGRGMNNWQGQPGPGGMGRPGRGVTPRQFVPQNWDQTNQPIPPRGRGWNPGLGQGRGWRQGMGPGWWQNPQPNTAPEANTPEPPIVEDQPEIQQGQ